MRENLDVIKRLLAIGLSVFLAGSTLFGDFIVIADQENHCEEFTDDYAYTDNGTLVPGENSDGYCDDCGRGEEFHDHIAEPEGEAAEVAAENAPDVTEDVATDIGTGEGLEPTTDAQIPENPEQPGENPENITAETGEAVENPAETQTSQETTPEETAETTDETITTPETETPVENIEGTEKEEETQKADTPQEEVKELDEIDEADKEAEEKRLAEEKEKEKKEGCIHNWEYTSNGDGTHVKRCTECGEEVAEECAFDGNGKCFFCGYEKAPEECEHEWEYTANNDGTHTKRCTKCGIEETEECQHNADGVCELCGYEDERLIHQTFTRTIHGVTVTVDGMIPRGSSVTIFTKPLDSANRLVNEMLDEGSFTALEVFDIDIYRRNGEKYQPEDDGSSVAVTFSGISELDEVSEDEEVAVFRIEDNETVTEVENEVVGENVVFDAEHFSQYAVGTVTSTNFRELKPFEKIAYIGCGASTYTRITDISFDIDLTGQDQETTTFTVKLYKNLKNPKNPESSEDVIDTQYVEVNKSAGLIGKVNVNFTQSDSSYILKGTYYSVVVSSDKSCKVGFKGASTDSTETYILSTSGFWAADSRYDGIFTESKDPTAPSDTYKIKSIASTNGDASRAMSAAEYVYGVQKDTSAPIDKLYAVFDSDIERTVAWSSDNEGVVSVNPTTGEIKAIKTGKAKITATYNNESYFVTVKVVGFTFTFDNTHTWDPDGSLAQPTYYYSGTNREPSIIASIGTSTFNITKKQFANNENAGTANVEIICDGKYVFNKNFIISQIPLNSAVFAGANIITDGSGNITEFTDLAEVEGVGVTPKYNSETKDFTYVINDNGINIDKSGIQYTMAITGRGNFTGRLDNVTITQKNIKVSDVFGVRLSASSRLANYYYSGTELELTETPSESVKTGWEEVEFYRLEDNSTKSGVITPANCSYKIYDSSKKEDSTSAGTHTIEFTMIGGGYTGSLSVQFEIKKPSLRNTQIEWINDSPNFRRTGEKIEPIGVTTFEGLAEDVTAFKVTYKDNNGQTQVVDPENYDADYSGRHTDIGSYTLTITGKKNYDSETNQQATYYIVANYYLDMRVRLYVDNILVKEGTRANNYETGYAKTYDGIPTAPIVKLYIPGEGELDNTGDQYYKVKHYDTNDGADPTANVGTKYLKIVPAEKLKNKYGIVGDGVTTATYTVEQCPLNSSKVQVRRSYKTKTYDTMPQELDIANDVSDFANKDLMIRHLVSGAALKYGKDGTSGTYDYTIKYSNNTNAGKATYIIEARKDSNGNYVGNYKGKIDVTENYFTIKKAKINDGSNGGTVEVSKPLLVYAYDGTVHHPTTPDDFTVKIGENTVSPSDYEVHYSENCISPTDASAKAYVQIDGKNNVEGSVRRYFDITASKEPYTFISIGGKKVGALKNPKKSLPDGTRVYTVDLKVPYEGKPYNGEVVVWGVGGQQLNRPGESPSYYAEFKNTVAAKNFNINDIENSPRLVITGLNNYAGNNAIIGFNVERVDIGDKDINFDATENDKFVKKWKSDSTAPAPKLEGLKIQIGDRTLVEGTSSDDAGKDYWVEYETESRPSTAGIHNVIIHGYGNYEGTRELQYTIGKDIGEAYVQILGAYRDDDVFMKKSADSNLATLSTKDSPLANTVIWRGNAAAPRIKLYLSPEPSDNITIPDNAYTLTMKTEFKNSDNSNNYCARQKGEETSLNYNVVTVTINADANSGYYGSATFSFYINPQNIGTFYEPNIGKPVYIGIKAKEGDSVTSPYTGDIQKIRPALEFYNGSNDLPYDLNSNSVKDFITPNTTTPTEYIIGPDLSDTIKTTLTGVGNFTGTTTHIKKITRGNINIFREVKKDNGSSGESIPEEFVGVTNGVEPDEGKAYVPYTKEGKGELDFYLNDESKTYYMPKFTYNGKSQIPNITLTSRDGSNKRGPYTLKAGTDYTVEYFDDTKNTANASDKNDTTCVGTKTIKISVNEGNFYHGTINLHYEITTNSIKDFKATLTPIKYKGELYTFDEIQSAINSGEMTLTVIDSNTGAELVRGEDFEIADTSELGNINAQFGTNYTDVIVAGEGYFEPRAISDKPNYIFIKGKSDNGGTYSEYCRVPFYTYLDISNSNSNSVNTLAKVYFDDFATPAKWKLDDESKLGENGTLKIMYKSEAGSDKPFDKELPLTSTVGNTTVKNYTITRGNAGKPGPDNNITVKGNNLASGVASGIKYNHEGTSTYETVCFLANLRTYQGISFTQNAVYDRNGKTYQPQPVGLQGTLGNSTANGDFVISYKYKKHSSDTDSKNVDFAKEAGYYELLVAATANSEYYTSDTGTRFSFYVKYNLDNATMVFYNDSDKPITEMSYTGQPYKINEKTKVISEGVTSADEKPLYNFYADDSNPNLVTLSKDSVTDVQYNPGYYITATPKDTELVSGSKTAIFAIKPVSLSDRAEFKLYDPWRPDVEYSGYEYTGGNIEPIVKGTVEVGNVKKELTEGVDFSVVYHKQDKAGTASFTIIGLGAYECIEFEPKNNTYTIDPLDLETAASEGKLRIKVAEATYGGYYKDYKNTTMENPKVKQEPEIEVSYVDASRRINNKLQMDTARVDGDYKIKYYANNTEAKVATAEGAPNVVIEAGRSGNTTKSTENYSTKFTINKLNLASGKVEIAQRTAPFTGGPINVFDVVKIKSGTTYKVGNVEYPVYLVQHGADADLDRGNLYDYDITVTKDGVTYRDGIITDIGTYNITIDGKNNCIGQIASETFTITERSLPDFFHYYYDANGFVGDQKPITDENNNNKIIGYEYTGGYKVNGKTTDTLKIKVYDVETVGAEDNPDNKPKVEIIDLGRSVAKKDPTTGVITYEPENYPLAQNEYTLSVENNTTAGTGEWAKTVTEDKHAPVAAGSPAVTITGAGSYSGTLTLPYSIGKNINNIVNDLQVVYTVKDTFEGYTKVSYDGTDKVAWHYTFNGAEQTPTVNTIKFKYGTQILKLGTDYTLTFTDNTGTTDKCINAGYKYAVITGKNTYCGTLKTKFAISKKEIVSPAKTFTNESTMSTTNGALTFAVSGGLVKRLSAEKAAELLPDVTNNDNFKNYYYAIYDGIDIKPTVTVKDNTLSKLAKTNVVSDADLEVTWPRPATASTFNKSVGTLNNGSYIEISFMKSTKDDFSTGSNYFVADGATTYRIVYLILEHNLGDDFYIQFAEEGIDGNGEDWDGNKHEPEILVKNGSRTLVKSEDDGETGDYLINYTNNIKPGIATVTVTGVNNYKGTKSATFNIWGDLAKTKIFFKNEDGEWINTEYEALPIQTYTGGAIVPDVKLVLVAESNMDQTDDVELTLGKEYIVGKNESSDGTFYSDGKVTFTGIAKRDQVDEGQSIFWTGNKELKYFIEYDENKVTLSIDKKTYKFTGYPIKPSKDEIDVSIVTAIKKDITYYRDLNGDGEISESEKITDDNDFIALGDIRVVMTYKVGDSDEKTAEGTYTIVTRPISDCTVVLSSPQRYTSRKIEPPYTIYLQEDGKIYNLTEYDDSTKTGDYSVDFGNYIYGDATAVFTGKSAEITGTKEVSYTIKLQNIVNLHVTEKTGDSLTVEWVRDLYSTGTELELQTGGKTVAIVKAVGKKNTQVFKNLKGSTAYTILARAYAVTSDGNVIFSHKDSSVTDTTDVASADMNVVSASKGKATVTWNSEGTVKVYYIYQSNNATDDGTLVAIIPATTGSFTKSKLKSGATYYFHTVGYGLDENSELKPVNKSEPKKVTVL